MVVTLHLPDDLAGQLDEAREDFLVEVLQRGLREFRIDKALSLYMQGGVSFGAAAEHAGVPQSELARHAFARGLEPPFSNETLQEELA